MSSKSESRSKFHSYLIKTVAATFLVPVILFIILMKTELNPVTSLLISMLIFCYLMVWMTWKTIKMYGKRTKIKKIN